MNTPIANKLAALTLALMVNGMIIGSMAVLFSGRIDSYTASVVAARPVAAVQA